MKIIAARYGHQGVQSYLGLRLHVQSQSVPYKPQGESAPYIQVDGISEYCLCAMGIAQSYDGVNVESHVAERIQKGVSTRYIQFVKKRTGQIDLITDV